MIYSNYMREKYRNTNVPRVVEGYPCILKKSKNGNLNELVIEGNTESKNIIPYPYTELKNSATENGITFTPNSDGTVTLNGTATVSVFRKITSFTLPKGFYRFAGVIDGYSATTYQCYLKNTTLNKYLYNQAGFYLDRECEIVIYCCVHKDISVENLTFSFMIQACNDNMLPMKTFSKTIEGVTYTGDSTLPYIRLNGTKYGASYANIFTDLNITLLSGKRYLIYVVSSGSYQYSNDAGVEQIPAIQFSKADGTAIQYVKIQNNETVSCSISSFTVSEDTIINRFSFVTYSDNVKYENFDVTVGLYEHFEEYEPYKAVGDLITDGDYAGKYKIPLTVHGKNLFNGYGFSAMGMITPTASRVLSNAVGTTISTTSPSNTLTVTQSNIYDSGTPNDYKNGYFCIGLNEDIKIGKRYRFYCDAEITNNPLNVSTFDLAPNNQMLGYTAAYNNGKLIGTFLYAKNGNRRFLELRIRGCNMTISNIMITEIKIKDTVYEPFLNPMTTSIYLDNPLGNNEYLDFKRQKLIKATSQTDVALPKVQVFKGTSVIRTDTEVSPTNIKAKYIKY